MSTLEDNEYSDKDNFLHFPLNVIIGRTKKAMLLRNSSGMLEYVFPSSQIGARFHDSQGEILLDMNIEAIEKINNEYPAPE
jgi:hypothetical protein